MALSRREWLVRMGSLLTLMGKAEAENVPPEATTIAMMPEADLRLTLTGGIVASGRAQRKRCDLELDITGPPWGSDSIGQGAVWGWAYDYNTADHFGTVRSVNPFGNHLVQERNDQLMLDVRLTIGEDPWVRGGSAVYRLSLKRKGNRVAGSYTGTYDRKTASGKVTGTLHAPFPHPLRPASATDTLWETGEHPRLVFRRAESERLRQRAETPWGRTIVARLRERLTDPMTYVGDYGANSAYFAAGYAFLHWLTGDTDAAKAARTVTAESLRTVPMRHGHQYAYSHHLPGLALAYDFSYDHWESEFRQEVVRYLEETSALVIAGRGPGFNHSPGSNWVARTRGGAGVALLAIAGDAGTTRDKERLTHLQKIVERSIARYLIYGTGERGFGPEGDGYHVESLEMVLPYLHARRVITGRSRDRLTSPSETGHDLTYGEAGEGAAWALPLYLLRSFATETGPRLHRYGRHGEATRSTPKNLVALGLSLVRAAHRSGVREFIDRFYGPAGDNSYALESPHLAPFLLNGYPDTTEPEPVTAVLPRAVQDTRKGFFVFRRGDIVATLYAKTAPSYGWNFPEAGTFRLFGLGNDWITRAGVGPRDAENVVVMQRAGQTGEIGGGSGQVLFAELKPDGSGTVHLNLDAAHRIGKERKDIGIRYQRTFLVDYSGASGAVALLVLTDRVRGGNELVWLLHTPQSDVRLNEQSFVIEGENKASLCGTFVAPEPVHLQIREKGSVRTIEARSHTNPDNVSEPVEFVVVLTLQQGNPPPVVSTGRGQERRIQVGGLEIRL